MIEENNNKKNLDYLLYAGKITRANYDFRVGANKLGVSTFKDN